MSPDVVPAYLRWAFLRAALARGWWLVTALYLVLEADLGAPRLILVGVFQGATVLAAEVPAGVLADSCGRRLVLGLGHLVTGAGMALTPLVTGYPQIVVTQCLWGLGWALSSGADVAWITDELDDPTRIDRVLVGQARRELLGQVAGIVGVGALAWATDRRVAMVAAGMVMVAQAAAVARWPEAGFTPPAPEPPPVPVTRSVGRPTDPITGSVRRRRRGLAVLREGLALARVERVVLVVLAATLLVNGGHEAYGRLFERRLLDLGGPAVDPVLWFTGLALAIAGVGLLALRVVESTIDGDDGPRRAAAAAGVAGVVGVLLFALAPDASTAAAGALLAGGIAFPVVGAVGTVLVNRRVTSRVRATVHSMVSQAEHLGEVVLGLALAGVADGAPRVALVVSAALVGAAGLVLSRGCRG